jgi:chromosome segregation ATPase
VAATAIYHYTKFAFTLGWHSNVFALLSGKVLEDRAAALRKERDALLAQISQRQTRIAELQGLVRQYEAQNLLELEQRRATAQTELQQEQEALRRLEDRLKRIEAQQGTSSPPPPPPTTTPQ